LLKYKDSLVKTK